MSGIHDLGLFVAAGLLLNLTPGPDMAYIGARAAAGGFRDGLAATFGITAGCIVHTLAAALGLSALIAASASAFTVIKWCGAAYLAYAGVRLMIASARAGTPSNVQSVRPARPAAILREAFVINVFNPKVALFFLAFLPQFIAAGEPHPLARMLELSAVFMLMTWVVFVLYGLFAAGVRDRVVSRPDVMRWLRRAFAGGFALLGARLALADR